MTAARFGLFELDDPLMAQGKHLPMPAAWRGIGGPRVHPWLKFRIEGGCNCTHWIAKYLLACPEGASNYFVNQQLYALKTLFIMAFETTIHDY